MKTLLLTCLVSYGLWAQGTYTRGYFITHDGTKTEALIKRFKISENPGFIRYKLSKEADFENLLLENLSQVSPNGKTVYQIATVAIDNTTDNLKELKDAPRSSEFEMEEMTLFLEILVTGKANLYKSIYEGREKFFYKTNGRPIEQLRYKRYYIPTEVYYIGSDYVKENNYYHRQLFRDVPCFKNGDYIDYPEYNDKTLKGYFKRYNRGICK